MGRLDEALPPSPPSDLHDLMTWLRLTEAWGNAMKVADGKDTRVWRNSAWLKRGWYHIKIVPQIRHGDYYTTVHWYPERRNITDPRVAPLEELFKKYRKYLL